MIKLLQRAVEYVTEWWYFDAPKTVRVSVGAFIFTAWVLSVVAMFHINYVFGIGYLAFTFSGVLIWNSID